MECERCGKHLSNKSNLLLHLKIKVPCVELKSNISREELLNKYKKNIKVGDKEYNCSKCNKGFNSRQGKYHHEKICSVTLIEEKKEPSIINNYTNCNINNYNYNPVIVINSLGNEKTPYITEDAIKKLFLQKPEGVFDLFKLKHTNNLIPENHNLRKKVHKDNFIEFYNGSKWESTEFNSVCKEVFRNLGGDILEFLNNNKDINLDDLASDDDKRERIIHSFFDKVGIPLEWYILFDSDVLNKYKDSYNLDWAEFDKKRKNLFVQAKETI